MRNLGTKENRLHDLKCQFEYLTKGGYTQRSLQRFKHFFTLNKDGMLILKYFARPPQIQYTILDTERRKASKK